MMVINLRGTRFAIHAEPSVAVWNSSTSGKHYCLMTPNEQARHDLGMNGRGYEFTLADGMKIVSHNVWETAREVTHEATAARYLTDKESCKWFAAKEMVAA